MDEKNRKMKKKSTKGDLFIGIDVGSSFVHYVVLDGGRKVIYSPRPIMHFANPVGAIKEAWRDIKERFDRSRIKNTAFTGSGAETFPNVMPGVTYVFDSVAIPKGADAMSPEAQYIFHMGAKDSYFFNLKEINNKKIIQEWQTGTKCGGGSGTLIEKQCRRLYEGLIPNPELENTAAAQEDEEKENIRIRNRARLQERLEEIFCRAEGGWDFGRAKRVFGQVRRCYSIRPDSQTE